MRKGNWYETHTLNNSSNLDNPFSKKNIILPNRPTVKFRLENHPALRLRHNESEPEGICWKLMAGVKGKSLSSSLFFYSLFPQWLSIQITGIIFNGNRPSLIYVRRTRLLLRFFLFWFCFSSSCHEELLRAENSVIVFDSVVETSSRQRMVGHLTQDRGREHLSQPKLIGLRH